MAARRSLEDDLLSLASKVREGLAASTNAEGDPGLRKLRKRLKRAQRKRGGLEARKRRGLGKQAGAQAGGASSG